MSRGVEVEIKAHIPSVDSISETIQCVWDSQELSGPFPFDKQDTYFCRVDDSTEDTLFRLRRLGDSAVVTHKKKSFIGACEINGETEFSVSDPEAFVDLVTNLGFRPCIEKRKIGCAWKIGGMTIELSDVPPLGAFIEIEIVLDPVTAHDGAVAQATDEIIHTLSRLGIPESAIEKRYYNSLLRSYLKNTTVS